MAAKVEIKESIAFIILSGKLDHSSLDDLHSAINTALDNNNATKGVQIDLKDVTFLDSSIIQALLILQTKASKERKTVNIIHCPATIKEILTIGGFDAIFKIQ